MTEEEILLAQSTQSATWFLRHFSVFGLSKIKSMSTPNWRILKTSGSGVMRGTKITNVLSMRNYVQLVPNN